MPWSAASDNLRVLSVREARDSWIAGWASVVFTTVHKQRLVPECPPHVRQHIWWFADTTDAEDPLAPTAAHVEAIAEAARSLTPEDRLIVHCHGGMNRSPAAALTVMTATGTSPGEAVDLLARIRPIANPNPLVVAHTEQLLGIDLTTPLRRAGLGLQGDPPGRR